MLFQMFQLFLRISIRFVVEHLMAPATSESTSNYVIFLRLDP